MFGDDDYAIGYSYAQELKLESQSIEVIVTAIDYFKEKALGSNQGFLAGLAQGMWDKLGKEFFVS